MDSKNPDRYVCVCEGRGGLITRSKQIYTLYIQNNTYNKIIRKTVSCCYIIRMLIQEYAEEFPVRNGAA